MTKVTSVNNAIAKAFDNGLDKDAVIVEIFSAFADLSLPKATKAVAEYMKANDMTVSRVGINAEFDDFLLSADPAAPRTAVEIGMWIEDNGSENTKRHRTHYERLGRLVAAGFAKGLAAK